MTQLDPSALIRIVEATTGVHRAQAAGLWLRTFRVGEPWRADTSGRVLLALDGQTPVAVARVQVTQFGIPSPTGFRVAQGSDAEALRAQMIDSLGGPAAAARNGDRQLAA